MPALHIVEAKSFASMFRERLLCWLVIALAVRCNRHTFQVTPLLPATLRFPTADLLRRDRRRGAPELLLHSRRKRRDRGV